MFESLITRCEARKNSLFSSKSAGFTLVETLVASTILFACLAAAALSYNTAVNLTHKLNSTVTVGIARNDIQEAVKSHLFDGVTSGERQSDDGALHYAWQARLQRASRTILRRDYDFGGELVYGGFNIQLYAVEIVVTSTHVNSPQQSRFEYTELVWHPVAYR
jgi:type II secretory pathway pseudopilin PulG